MTHEKEIDAANPWPTPCLPDTAAAAVPQRGWPRRSRITPCGTNGAGSIRRPDAAAGALGLAPAGDDYFLLAVTVTPGAVESMVTSAPLRSPW